MTKTDLLEAARIDLHAAIDALANARSCKADEQQAQHRYATAALARTEQAASEIARAFSLSGRPEKYQRLVYANGQTGTRVCVGLATFNEDGSLTVTLDALPLNGRLEVSRG
ncbi:MAG TPA: hypothetical protein VEA38_07130 [Terriglobales bacterium]|nr:hypothetical protein [Terriglobales bacterium]